MDSQKQEEIYLLLLRAWRNEVTSSKIGVIKEKDIFLKNIQELIANIKDLIKKNNINQQVISTIYEKTLKNIRYMIQDLFNVRSEKILNNSRSLQKIDENLLFSVEKDYYYQLFSAFKGDSKTKKFILSSLEKNGLNSVEKKKIAPPIESTNKGEKKEKKTIGNGERKSVIIEPKELSNNDIILLENNQNQVEQAKSNIQLKSPPQVLQNNSQHKKIEYSLIRIKKNIPAMVGKDLKIYGPFQIEDVVRLPFQNASILIEENAAVLFNI